MDKSLNMNICKTCSGEYESVTKDGYVYYHACAPISNEDGSFSERVDKRDENIGKIKNGKGIDVIAVIEE